MGGVGRVGGVGAACGGGGGRQGGGREGGGRQGGARAGGRTEGGQPGGGREGSLAEARMFLQVAGTVAKVSVWGGFLLC